MATLLVTSVNREIYAATGIHLIESFLASGSDGTLLICHEGFGGGLPFRHRRLRTNDIGRAVLLRRWIEDNRDIVPKRFGGSAVPCDCLPGGYPFGRHRPRCRGFWFNQNAYRWFRKVVSLDYACRLPGYRRIVWVDSDCVFKARLPEREVSRWFQGASVFYLKSRARKVIESGVLGIRTTRAGIRFIESTVDRYRSGAFRRDARWDDGYQFQRTLETDPGISRVDLATGAIGKRPYGHVVPCSPVGQYIVHQKGVHGPMFRLR